MQYKLLEMVLYAVSEQKRRNELRNYEPVFVNEKQLFRNGISNLCGLLKAFVSISTFDIL